MNLTQHTTDATETIRNAILAKPDGILEHSSRGTWRFAQGGH